MTKFPKFWRIGRKKTRSYTNDVKAPPPQCISRNDTQWINRLPPELLGKIFVLTEHLQRGPRLASLPYSGFQDVAVQVCQYWRELAINTPMLWTYIFISQHPPHPLAKLYLARSGKCPLDLDMEMKTEYIGDIQPFIPIPQVKLARETLDFIVEHGGTLDRWRSLIVHAKVPEVLFEMSSFINIAATPALQFVSLKWKVNIDWVEAQENNSLLSAEEKLDDSCSLSHGPQRPRIRRVDLDGMPSAFIFRRQSPFLSNLTRLKLVCAHVLYTIKDLSSLLAANPQLEHLTLDMGVAESRSVGNVKTGPFQVSLPHLRYWSLNATNAYDWGVFLLQIVDAPDLETFEIHATTNSTLHDADPATVSFMRIGRKNGLLMHNGTNPSGVMPPVYGPPFPALKHFILKHVRTASQRTIRKMLEAYPTVTKATVSFPVLFALADNVELLPNLSHLVYSGTRRSGFAGTMQRFVQSRSKPNAPFPEVTIEFTGTAEATFDHVFDTPGIDYMLPLSDLVGHLDIYDNVSPYVSDSDYVSDEESLYDDR
ncbi:F-box-like protein [Ceratobasidium sp. AG-Ba]|nr:F-box-like protein [Ceratobasidium sp. AG-Ba]